MKSFRLILLLMFFAVATQAQSLSLYDLTNLAALNNAEAGNYLIHSKTFKLLYTQKVEGQTIAHYGNIHDAGETVIVGNGTKTSEGRMLHLVKYSNKQTSHILEFVVQASASGLAKSFQGNDATHNIYLFGNLLYAVNIYLNNDNSAGDVEVQEKDYLDY